MTLALTIACLALAADPITSHDVVWSSPSADERGSMPLGNGDIAANVWCEPDGSLALYLAKSDAWDDNARLLKVGRLRLRVEPNPLEGDGPFMQRLDLHDGEIEVTLGGESGVSLAIAIDANRPVCVIDVTSSQPVDVELALDHWRTREREIAEVTWSDVYCVDWKAPPKRPMVTSPDTFLPAAAVAGGAELVWHHRNERTPIPDTFSLQSAEPLLSRFDDPILHRTFGARVVAAGFVPRGERSLRSRVPSTRHTVEAWLLTQPSGSGEAFVHALRSLPSTFGSTSDATRRAHREWWHGFWNRSWIRFHRPDVAASDPPQSPPTEPIERAYVLQRFMNACAGRGGAPIKFNGSLFTVARDGHDGGDPDYRRWGPGYWFQNTRLIYWPMFASGDADLTDAFFAMYVDALPLLASIHALRHGDRLPDGAAAFHETIYFWGMPDNASFGWNREGIAPGEVGNPYIRHYRSGSIELLVMALERHAYTQDRAFLERSVLPLARAVLGFYSGFYPRTPEGTIVFEPCASLETWHDATDPLPEIAGLRDAIDRLLRVRATDLPPSGADILDRARQLRAALPEIPTGQAESGTTLLPAHRYAALANVENPELYAVFPYRLFCVGTPGVDVGRRTFAARRNRANRGWCQDSIHAAYLGLADEAASMLAARAEAHDPESRFPAFWGPNYDWVPDQTHGANVLMTLQSMLMQCDGDRITLLPAWPRSWACDFRLHAPRDTIVEGSVRDGHIDSLRVTPPVRRADVVVLGTDELSRSDLDDTSRFGRVLSDEALVRTSSTSPWDEPERHRSLVGEGHRPFAFHTAEESKPWVWVDLGAPRRVTAIEIANRSDGNGVRTTALGVALSTDGVHWTDVAQLDGPRRRWRVSLLDGSEPREARYVRVQLSSKGYLHLSRIRVWGEPQAKGD